MKKLLLALNRHMALLSLLLTIPALSVFYDLLNNADRGVHSLATDIDRAIPFLNIMIVPYVAWYPFLFLTLVYLCVQDRKTYFTTLISLNISLIVCYVIYFLYQTTTIRPALSGDDPLVKLTAAVYSADPPYNCFPSIHCVTSYLMMKAAYPGSIRSKAARVFIKSSGSLIMVSTLFVKQHVLLDAVGAIFLGETMYRIVHYAGAACAPRKEKLNRKREYVWPKKRFSLSTMKKKY